MTFGQILPNFRTFYDFMTCVRPMVFNMGSTLNLGQNKTISCFFDHLPLTPGLAVRKLRVNDIRIAQRHCAIAFTVNTGSEFCGSGAFIFLLLFSDTKHPSRG